MNGYVLDEYLLRLVNENKQLLSMDQASQEQATIVRRLTTRCAERSGLATDSLHIDEIQEFVVRSIETRRFSGDLSGMLDEMTRLGTVMGSPQFMSPEQAQGNTRQIGPHTDVYGLGATLYYVLTRQPPIAGRNALEIIGNIPSVDPVPPDSIDRTIPEHISLVVMKAIAKEPANRYPNMDMFGEDLDRVLSGRVPLAKLQAHSRLRDSSVMSTVRAVGSSILKSISTRFKGETKPNEAEPPLARADRK